MFLCRTIVHMAVVGNPSNETTASGRATRYGKRRSEAFVATRPVSTVEAIAEALRDRVLNGELAPGTPLREVELSRHFGVGRHSLRAALQSLTAEGLLEHAPNRG